MKEFLNNIQEKQNELNLDNTQIQELIADGTVFETEVQTCIDYDDTINETKFKIKLNLKKFKNDSDQGNTNTISNASTIPYSITRSPARNLPKINIPTFKGDPNTFMEFINSFKSTKLKLRLSKRHVQYVTTLEEVTDFRLRLWDIYGHTNENDTKK